jgi:hypothetical protein
LNQEDYLAWYQAQHTAPAVAVRAPDPRLTFEAPLPAPRPAPSAWTTGIGALPAPAPEPIREIGPDDCEEGLSIKQMKAVDCILRGLSQMKASEVVGVTRRTVCDWVKQPAFKKVLRARRKEQLEVSMVILQKHSAELSTTLVTLAQNPLIDPADRIRASVSALKMIQEMQVQEDILDRLDQLEVSRNAGTSDKSFSRIAKVE